MHVARTTTCCSAVALIAGCALTLAAVRDAPLTLLPTRQAWTLALNNALTAPPAYDAARAFFAIDGDRLVAYALDDGRQLWLEPAAVRLQPATGEDKIFTLEDDALKARSAADGSAIWQQPFADAVTTRPVWDNGWLVVGTDSGTIRAYRGLDGQPMWSRDLKSAPQSAPALAADRVYVPTSDGRIVALKVEDGTVVWERRIGGAGRDLMAFDDRVYAGSNDNHFYCLLAKDGRINWRWPTGGDVIGLPAFDERLIYFVSLDNMLRGLDRRSGAQRWIRALPMRPAWGPVRAREVLVVAGLTQAAQAFDPKDGNRIGEVPAGADIAAAPHYFEDPRSAMPSLLLVTRHISQGAAAIKLTRRFEESGSPLSAPLPNVIPMSASKAQP